MLSIDISNTNIYLAEAEIKGGTVSVRSFETIPTPEGSVKNGVITNMTELSGALRECIRKKGFKSKKAVVNINSTAIVTREVTVPEVREKEMLGLLIGEIEQSAASKQEYILDYVVLERFRQQDADMCRVLCIVVPKVIVEGYRDLIEKYLGLKAQSLGVLQHSFYKLICRDPSLSDGKAVLLAGVHEDELCLVLAEGDSKVFYRTTPINVTRDVVESEYILSAFGGNDLVSADTKRQQIVSAVSENISKLMQFQLIKNKEQPVSRVLLCGGLSDDAELMTRVAELMEVPTGVIQKPEFVRCPEGMAFNRYIGAVSVLIEL